MTKIEEVARAIYEKAIDTPTTDPWPEAIARGLRYGGAMPPMVRQAYAAARAAIEAMREPSEAMLDAAHNEGFLGGEHGDTWEHATPREAWAAMIDAALNEGEKG